MAGLEGRRTPWLERELDKGGPLIWQCRVYAYFETGHVEPLQQHVA
jgi:hypothetical protein